MTTKNKYFESNLGARNWVARAPEADGYSDNYTFI